MAETLNNIVFIGGIHGSGKGQICDFLTAKTELVHLTASQVIKWEELSPQEEKIVRDISETQNRLITNLNSVIENGKSYLLDGHYCLLNKDGNPEKVPIQTFIDINPIKLILVYAEPIIIKERLEVRDSKKYDLSLITDFQNLELEFAKEISEMLAIPLLSVFSQQFNPDTLFSFLNESFT